MKGLFPTVVIASACVWLLAGNLFAADDKPAAAPAAAEDTEAKYTKAIEGRTADILIALALTNAVTATNVHDIVIAQWRGLRAWHDGNDAALKEAGKSDTNRATQIKATLKALHDGFLGKLSAQLTPEQVTTVKDKMTYGIVKVTYNAYLEKYPDLTEAEKQQLMAWLVEAREIAMDAGSSEDKHAAFGKYKGRINNYLSKEGYDGKTGLKKASAAGANQPAM